MHLTPSRETLPTDLRENARWTTIGPASAPAMLVHPQRGAAERGEKVEPVPIVLWFHGRTANKELDPGRYLRWMRAGIGTCAIDLPGHGEREDAALQEARATLEVVAAMADEIDGIVDALTAASNDSALPAGGFDPARIAIGGMSAGGMVALARLCRPHQFVCASVEATTGSWGWQGHRAMFHATISERLNPIAHLDRWRPIPLQAIHARHDEWVAFDGQVEFLDAVRLRHEDPSEVEVVVFDRTGAPSEHLGFGRCAADAKERQLEFLKRRLLSP